jgi:outer membrane immunogenic protein
MRTLVILAATAAATAAAPAVAQEENPFTGPRVEATIGYDRTQTDDGLPGTEDNLSSARLGVAIGYDLALAKSVTIGAEAGIGFGLGNGRGGTVGGTSYRLDDGRDIDLSLRLGFRAGARTLVYGKAGYANSRFTARVSGGEGGTFTSSANAEGFRAGVGVEHMLSDHAYAKAEYRYTSYGEGVDRHQALVGFGYRF